MINKIPTFTDNTQNSKPKETRHFTGLIKHVSLVVNTSQSFPHSRLITGFVTRLTRRVHLVKRELPTLPEYLSSPPVFGWVRVTRFLVLCVCFVDRCLSYCTFSFGHCFVWSSSLYGFWLPLWYLQTLIIFKSWFKTLFLFMFVLWLYFLLNVYIEDYWN